MSIFTQSYPAHAPLKRRVLLSFAMSSFVFLFLLIFQPFDLDSTSKNIVLITAGYGLCCLLVMLFLNIVVVELFPAVFREEKWTVLKEVIWVIVNIALIGFANALYSVWALELTFSIRALLWFELYTLAVAIIPVFGTVLINYYRLRSKYAYESDEINAGIRDRMKGNRVSNNTVSLKESDTVFACFLPENLLYVKAADNYIEVHFLHNNGPCKQLLRMTLRNALNELVEFDYVLQVHRSYIVNMNRVLRLSGNAQGIKLHLESVTEVVPVSRNLTQTVKKIFAVDH